MRQIVLPAVDDEQVYDQVTAAKRQSRPYLLSARSTVFDAYDSYATAAPDLAHLPPVVLTKRQQEALIHAYSVETKPFARLREQLADPVILARCPFCGIGETSTLDHYLPKELHPQFAIYSRNLVACCSPCNTRKSDLVLNDATDTRLFLHPYFDLVPNKQFVTVQITLMTDALGLSFRLRRPAGLPTGIFQHLESHFRLLRLADRYRRMSLEHLRSTRKGLERFYGSNCDAVRVAAELNRDADDWEDDFGPNHWRVVLYRALAADVSFCDGGFLVLNRIQ